MGEENLDDKILDDEFRKVLAVYQFGIDVLKNYENKEELIGILYKSMKFWEEQYIDFRLDKFDSEGRKVIREVYNILGYNPYNPKQIQ
jgi:hypothetical protein